MKPGCWPLLLSLALLLFASVAKGQVPAVPEIPRDPLVDRAYKAAEGAYQRGQYKRVIELIRPLVIPKTRINSKPRLLSAYKLLAISYVFEKDIPAAESAFGAILAEDPKYDLDPAVDPAAAVRVFRAYKRRNAAMLRKIEQAQVEARKREVEERKRREEELRQLREAAKHGSTLVERRVVERHFWLNFVPFGAGQFQNGHRVKGWLLFAAQLALGATSLGTAVAYRAAFPDIDKDAGRALEITQLSTGGLFWALAIYGIIDALVYFQPRSVTETRRRRKLDSASHPPAPFAFSLSPRIGQKTVGLGVSVTF